MGCQGSNILMRSVHGSDFIEHYSAVMQEWADFVAETLGPVVPDGGDQR